MRHLTAFFATLALIACGPAAAASSTTTDYSDLWWNASESGWGLSITQHEKMPPLLVKLSDLLRQ